MYLLNNCITATVPQKYGATIKQYKLKVVDLLIITCSKLQRFVSHPGKNILQ